MTPLFVEPHHVELASSAAMPSAGYCAVNRGNDLFLVRDGQFVAKLNTIGPNVTLSAPIVQVGSRSSDCYWYIAGN